MGRLWPRVAAAAQAWPGTAITDLGRLQLRHAASPMAAAATTVLLVTRAATREDLYHARERAGELAARLGQGPHGRSPLAVAVVGPAKDGRRMAAEVQHALASQAATSTIPVAGFLADDSRGLDGLLAGGMTRRLMDTDLLRSAKTMAETLLGWFPELVAMSAPSAAQMAPSHVTAYPPPLIDPSPDGEYSAWWGTPAAGGQGGVR
jgi:hypothetical protein